MAHGGRRPNAGRKRGSGRWGEPTKAIRVPISKLDAIYKLLLSALEKTPEAPAEPSLEDLYWRPLYQASLSSSFNFSMAEPAEKFNLHAYLLPHPESIVFVRAPDGAMTRAGIDEGDILIVDRRHPLTPGRIVAAIVNDELVIRHLMNDEGNLLLLAANPLFSPLRLTGDTPFALLGVAVTALHALRAPQTPLREVPYREITGVHCFA